MFVEWQGASVRESAHLSCISRTLGCCPRGNLSHKDGKYVSYAFPVLGITTRPTFDLVTVQRDILFQRPFPTQSLLEREDGKIVSLKMDHDQSDASDLTWYAGPNDQDACRLDF